MNHIDFDPSLTSEETNVPERDLKLKSVTKMLIPQLKLRMDDKLIHAMNFESKHNKLKSCFQEEKHVSLIILTLDQRVITRSMAMVLTEDVPPHTLHMNTRILEKKC